MLDRFNRDIHYLRISVTDRCNLRCTYCMPEEGIKLIDKKDILSLEEIVNVVKVGAEKFGIRKIRLTGGEPLLRDDIFEIAAYGTQKGFRMVMAPNGTLVTEDIANKLVAAGIKRISISLDGATAQSHDNFRKVDGAFEGAVNAMKIAKKVGLDFQVNTTITKTNLDQIPKIQQLAVERGAVAHHIFLLVPTGRGKYIVDTEINAAEYEETLNWFYDQREKTSLQLKATCAPHYYRILRQRAHEEGKKVTFETHGLDAVTRGCLAGTGFCFISHVGRVQTCGFLDVTCGDITKQSFRDVWENSRVFNELRDFANLESKCGICEFKKICSGCRARAYGMTLDYLGEEPFCTYEPRAAAASGRRAHPVAVSASGPRDRPCRWTGGTK